MPAVGQTADQGHDRDICHQPGHLGSGFAKAEPLLQLWDQMNSYEINGRHNLNMQHRNALFMLG